jgi:hypothetical protein
MRERSQVTKEASSPRKKKRKPSIGCMGRRFNLSKYKYFKLMQQIYGIVHITPIARKEAKLYFRC